MIGKLIKKVLYFGTFAFILKQLQQPVGDRVPVARRTGVGGVRFVNDPGPVAAAESIGASGRGSRRDDHAADQRPDGLSGGVCQPGRHHRTVPGLAWPGLAWLVLIVSFFVLAVQLFVTLIEFKLATLAGFVLVPFALWKKTAFLAERVLGNVVSSGIKVLVLAVIVRIGTGLFAEFTVPPGTEPSIDHALVIMLAALAMLGLGISGRALRRVWCLVHLSSERVRRRGRRWVQPAWQWPAVLRWQVRVLRWPLGPGWRRELRERLLAPARAPRGLRRAWPAGRNRPTRPAPPHRALAACARPVRASPTSRAAAPVP